MRGVTLIGTPSAARKDTAEWRRRGGVGAAGLDYMLTRITRVEVNCDAAGEWQSGDHSTSYQFVVYGAPLGDEHPRLPDGTPVSYRGASAGQRG